MLNFKLSQSTRQAPLPVSIDSMVNTFNQENRVVDHTQKLERVIVTKKESGEWNNIINNSQNNIVPLDTVDSKNDVAQTSPLIIDQMINALDEIKGKNLKELVIKLKPENLGELSIKLVSSSEGITAIIKSIDSETKSIILGQLSQLQEAFRDKGIRVTNIDVVSQNLQQQYQQGSQGRFYQQEKRKSQENRNGFIENIEVKPFMTTSNLIVDELTINYLA